VRIAAVSLVQLEGTTKPPNPTDQPGVPVSEGWITSVTPNPVPLIDLSTPHIPARTLHSPTSTIVELQTPLENITQQVIDASTSSIGLDLSSSSTDAGIANFPEWLSSDIPSTAGGATSSSNTLSLISALSPSQALQQQFLTGATPGLLPPPTPSIVSPLPIDDRAHTHVDRSSGDPTYAKEAIADLQREVLMLRNELNFELWLKQQHLGHMRRLQLDRITARGEEAERQNLASHPFPTMRPLSNVFPLLSPRKTDLSSIKHFQTKEAKS